MSIKRWIDKEDVVHVYNRILTWLKQLSSSSSRYGPLLQLSLTLKLGASILSDETMLSLTASHRRLCSPHLSPGAGAVVSQTRWDSAIAQQWQQPSWHFSVSSVHTLWKITFPVTSLEVQWLRLGLPLQGVQVWSLVRELRSHMLLGQKTKTGNRSSTVTGSIKTSKMVYIKMSKTKKKATFPPAYIVNKDHNHYNYLWILRVAISYPQTVSK